MKGEQSTSTEVDALANLTALPGGTGLFIRKTGATTFENATEAGLGSVTQVSVVTANGVSGSVATASTTPAITLTLGDITPSSVTVSGLTASELVATNGTKVLTSLAVATYPSLTEISYVKGVTSGIQSQLNGKLATGLAVLLDQTTPQTITGGSPIIPSIDGSAADNGDLTLQGTSSATRTTSYVILQPNGGNVGIGTTAPNQLLTVENSMSLKEIASANADTAAYGQIWVKSDTPNTLWFTNDAGTDVQLGVAIPIEGTAVLSTGEAGGTKFLREDGDGTCSWQTVDLSSKADVGQTFYIGTTQVAINRASNALTLAGITLTTPDIGTPSAGTLTNCTGYANDINLPKGKQINLTLPDTTETCTGNVSSSWNAGYSSAIGDLVFFGSGGKWLEVDADAVATCKGLMGIALEAKTDGQAMKVALPGSMVHLDAWNWTVGATLYAGETLGAMQETIPTGADAIIRVVGFAVDADTIYFQPSSDQQSTVA